MGRRRAAAPWSSVGSSRRERVGSCRALGPTIDAIADDLAGSVKVGKVNTDENQAVAAKYGITSIPTVMVFKDGRLAKRLVGLRPLSDFMIALGESVAA